MEVSPESIQILTAAVLGVVGSLAVYRLARVRRLSFRYAVGWLTLCGIGMFAGIAAPILEPLARSLKVSPAVVIALGAVVLLVAICIQLSISISGLQEQNRQLTEHLAHLRLEMEEKISELGK